MEDALYRHRTRRHASPRRLKTAIVTLALIASPFVGSARLAGAAGPPVVYISPLDIAEEGGTARFLISAANAQGPIDVLFSTIHSPVLSPVMATRHTDYVPVSGRRIRLESPSHTVTTEVTILDDTQPEGPELLMAEITLAPGSGSDPATSPTVASRFGFSVIDASDVSVTPPTLPRVTIPTVPGLGPLAEIPKFAINDVTQVEGTGGSNAFGFTVQRDGNSLVPASVRFETVDGSAVAGQDYEAREGFVHFATGEKSESIDVPVIGDRSVEGNEAFSVRLRNPSWGSVISDDLGVGTILDDDAAPVPPVNTTPRPPARRMTTVDGGGYWLHDRTGQVGSFGNAPPIGSLAQLFATAAANGLRIVSMATTQTHPGAWLLDNRGGVYTLGSGQFYGSMPGLLGAGRITSLLEMADIAPLSTGDGYALLSRDGGVFTFGNARFFGSLHTLVAERRLTAAPSAVAMAYTPSGNGYWIASSDGGVFAFGDAPFHGSMPGLVAEKRIAQAPHIVEIAPVPGGSGYALVDHVGGIFTFGTAGYHGSVPGLVAAGVLKTPVNALTIDYTPSGNGYWIFGRTGGVYTFGDAAFFGAAQFADDTQPKAEDKGKRRRGRA